MQVFIDIPGAIFDGSVTAVGREQDRTNRHLEAQNVHRNRPCRTSENRIEPPNSAYESEGRRFESCRARQIKSCKRRGKEQLSVGIRELMAAVGQQ
jgi:hypothetical protein